MGIYFYILLFKVMLKRSEVVLKRLGTIFFCLKKQFTIPSPLSLLRHSTPTMRSQRLPSSWRRRWTTSWWRWMKRPVKWGWWEAWLTPSQKPWARWVWAPRHSLSLLDTLPPWFPSDLVPRCFSVKSYPSRLSPVSLLFSWGCWLMYRCPVICPTYYSFFIFIDYFGKPVVPFLPILYRGKNGDGDGIIGSLTYKMEIIIYLPCLPHRVVVGNKLQNEIMKWFPSSDLWNGCFGITRIILAWTFLGPSPALLSWKLYGMEARYLYLYFSNFPMVLISSQMQKPPK